MNGNRKTACDSELNVPMQSLLPFIAPAKTGFKKKNISFTKVNRLFILPEEKDR